MEPTCKVCRKLERTLRGLSDAVLVALDALDKEMVKPSTHERGQTIAKICNFLGETNDRVLFLELRCDYHHDGKAKALKAAKKKLLKR